MLCSQSDLQVLPTDPVGETTCPACGAVVSVPKASPVTVWPELRTRWPSHARPEDEPDPDAAYEEMQVSAREA